MKTVVKLVIMLALLNAVARSGYAWWNYYQLKDGTQQLLTFGLDVTPDQLASEILQRATDLNIPLDAENIEVRRDGVRTSAAVSYTQPIEFFPRYVYPVEFSFSVDSVAMRPGKIGDAVRPR
jgi:hypothetical protein